MNREELINFADNTFIKYGIKTVSPTDKSKGAYVPNIQQKEVFSIMNIDPFERRRDIVIKELFSSNMLTISYYGSQREGSDRTPEIRMGLSDLINYFEVDDEILFATDNVNIFIYNLSKLESQSIDSDDSEEKLYSQINIYLLRQKVQTLNTIPTQVQREINIYLRNNALRALVKARANYSCEMPDCDYIAFEKENGEKYIEVHHLIPLSEGGEDSISNTVALCPTCHRKIHYSQNKGQLKEILEEYIGSLE
ncbi:MAG: HNH endonuclease [Arcobacteraceae bacterium]|nr:HNH endonuclease [Arcobacteraceae bacterium]